jgi:hypothetical protein
LVKKEDISALLAEGEATATEDSKEKSTDEALKKIQNKKTHLQKICITKRSCCSNYASFK